MFPYQEVIEEKQKSTNSKSQLHLHPIPEDKGRQSQKIAAQTPSWKIFQA